MNGDDPKSGVATSDLRRILGHFATGVAVVTTTSREGRHEALTVNSFSSVSLNPPLVLWCLRRESRAVPAFAGSDMFAVNILGSHQQDVSAHFARAKADIFAGVRYRLGKSGCPLLETVAAHLECRLENTIDAGDHLIFIGRIIHAAHEEREPLVFSKGRYCVPAPLQPVPRLRRRQATPEILVLGQS